ncbi:MFS transporter [bacterium]|nr:MFS transporter [bacterium]
MANFQRVAIPGAIFDVLQTDLSLKAPSVTALGAIFMYSYAISLLFCGILADRYGAVKVILGGSLLFSLGSIIFPNTNNIYMLYLSRAILGVGAATFYLCLIQEAKKCFPDKYFGISVSLMLITGYMGGVCANAPFIWITNFFQWQSVLNLLGIITTIVTLLFCFERGFLHHIPVNEHAKFSVEPFKEVLSKHFNHNLFLFAGINYGLYYVIQTVIGVKFLKDYVQMSAAGASTILSIMIVVAGISGLSLASLSTMFNNRRVIFMKTVCIITSSIFALISIFLFLGIKTKLIALMLLFIAIGGGMSPLLVPIIHATNKYEVRGTALSIMNCCFFLSVGILSTLVGYLLDVFKPLSDNMGHIIYSSHSYLLVFTVFFVFSLIEMYNVFKLKDV